MLRSILLTAIFAVLISWSLRRAWLGILVWAWFSYMNPHRMAFGFAYNFPFVAIAAAVTFYAWLSSKENKRFPWTIETYLQVMLCFWITFTSFFGDSDFVWEYWNRAIKVQIMIFMTLWIMRSKFRLEALVWTIVISIGFFGVKGGIWTILTGGHGRVQGPDMSFIQGNNEIALAMVMVLPLMRYLQLQATQKQIRRGLIAMQILTTLAVLSTYSRAGLLALGMVGALFWLKSRHKIAFGVAMLLVIAPMIKFMPSEWRDRMRSLEATDESQLDDSAKGRINSWRFAVNLAMHRPITGGGFRVFMTPTFFQYAPDPTSRHDAHSIYFETLGEHGFPGLFLFLSLGFCTWMTARKVARRARKIPELAWMVDLVSMAQVGLCGFAVGGAFAGLAFFDLPYDLMAMIVLCKFLLQDHERAKAMAHYPSAGVPVETGVLAANA
ncbi:MAG: putative O-glycosylation ligase, exosortase A system-associated [Bryobacterales bacterium]|nr:putative O-glycosylation ligase, exosortase A system-associated [Bryobacterales bacterium]MBV9397674.1 putative O-glycosylation ligase, exosortase A system-associated [Bryobacterales bacterium]